MRALLQVVSGAALCVVITAVLIYSPLPLFWEHEDEPHVYSISWHSALVLVLLALFTQWIAHIVFCWIGKRRKQSHRCC